MENIDLWLGRILEKINLKNTIVIFTADHGDYILSIDDAKKNSLNQEIKSKIREKIPNSTYDFFARKKLTVGNIWFFLF